MIYVIDFDNTIFNTSKLKNILFGIKWKNYVNTLSKSYEYIKEKYWFFNLEEWILSNWIDRKLMLDIENFLNDLIYKDFYMFIENIKTKIILVTYWEDSFQRWKIVWCKVDKYFEKIIITKDRKKKNELINIYNLYNEKIVYIDDVVLVNEKEFDFPIKIVTIDRRWIEWDIQSLDEIDINNL